MCCYNYDNVDFNSIYIYLPHYLRITYTNKYYEFKPPNIQLNFLLMPSQVNVMPDFLKKKKKKTNYASMRSREDAFVRNIMQIFTRQTSNFAQKYPLNFVANPTTAFLIHSILLYVHCTFFQAFSRELARSISSRIVNPPEKSA